MEKYDGGEGKWEKWWFYLTTVIGGVDQELERVLVEVTDPTTKVETKEEMERVVGMELLGKYSGGLFTAISSLTTGETSTVVKRDGVEGRGEVWISSGAKIDDA